jgi:hypothetical protein
MQNVKWAFVGELLKNSLLLSGEPAALKCAGVNIDDLTSVLPFEQGIFGFSGLFILENKQGKVYLKYKLNAAGGRPNITKSFPLESLGLSGAFKEAVQFKADTLGYSDELPALKCPTLDELMVLLKEKFDESWFNKNKDMIANIKR